MKGTPLTEEQRRSIVARAKQDHTSVDIAIDLQVGKSTVNKVLREENLRQPSAPKRQRKRPAATKPLIERVMRLFGYIKDPSAKAKAKKQMKVTR